MFVCLVVVHACACIRTHSTSFPFSYLQIAPVVVRVCVESSHTSSWFERPSLNGLRLSIRVQNCHFFESPLWWIFVSVLCSISLNCFHFWGKKKSFLPFVSQTFFFFVHFSNLWDHFRINLLRHTYACCRRSLCAPIGHADRIDRNWLTPKCVRFHRSLCFRLIDHPNRSRVLTLTSSQSIHHLIDHRQLWSFNPLTIVFWILTHVDWKKSHTHTHSRPHFVSCCHCDRLLLTLAAWRLLPSLASPLPVGHLDAFGGLCVCACGNLLHRVDCKGQNLHKLSQTVVEQQSTSLSPFRNLFV